ncbi:GtrA family protein [Corynebacterium heidelbergense]|uniref:GtrA/DPMS transmembrane domain-containing protein n=1 Tax=Corynebacterium heidelbergense TaxID=2055947 RepID=A0A364V9H5_9CORY|nr:GtrA family protein [Corynebacterium heidelbergense]RAV33310.1 hypothetical protein CWC39_09140 [Corynebacterium heidelbergense]WCZ37566.1 GtrA-like protein [Corynebacterium heidelbergense]
MTTTEVMAEQTVRNPATLNQQLFRFIAVGAFSAIVDFGTTAGTHFLLDWSDGVSKAVGFILGTLTAYFINRRWTFQAEKSFRRFAVTMLTYLLTFAVQWGLYRLTIPWLNTTGLPPLGVRIVSFIIAQGMATVINFAIQRFLIFRR